MSFQYECMYYTMWVGVALASTVLLPLPRILRKPLVKGLETILTNKIMSYVLIIVISWISFLFVQAFTENKHFSKQLIEQKATRDAAIEGVSRFEMDKTVNQTRMQMFFSQRNIYLSSFTLLLFAAVFTYMKSLQKLDKQLDDEEKLQKKPKPTPGEVKK